MKPFNKNGGPIFAEVSAGQAQTGSYDLKLWEADKNVIVKRWEGDFLNPDDDKYKLPGTNEENNKRQVQAVVVIALLAPIDRYSATLTITQDGNELDKVTIANQTNDPSVILNLYTTLEQA